MKFVLAVLVMCLCLAGCWTPLTTSNVLDEYQRGLDDYDGTAYLSYSVPDSTYFYNRSILDQRPEVRWSSMFDFDPRETSLSFSLAWDLARSNAWDSETKPRSNLDYNVDWDIFEFTP